MIGTGAKTIFALLLLAASCLPASAQTATVTISVKNHRFQPAQI